MTTSSVNQISDPLLQKSENDEQCEEDEQKCLEGHLPPPNLSERTLEVHEAIATMLDLDPRFSLESQGVVSRLLWSADDTHEHDEASASAPVVVVDCHPT